jgi:hypothetical protein
MNLKSLQHERRRVTYINKQGDVNVQVCYIKYVGKNYVEIYPYCKLLKVARNRVLKVETPTGKIEYQK